MPQTPWLPTGPRVHGTTTYPQDLKRDAMAASRRFVSCVPGLPPVHAALLWRAVSAEARHGSPRKQIARPPSNGAALSVVNLGRGSTRLKFLLHLLRDSPNVEIVVRPTLIPKCRLHSERLNWIKNRAKRN